MRRLRTIASLAILILWGQTAIADEGQRVILVLDGSGSMWGQIDGRTKIDIAKDVVGKVIEGWKPEDELGLVAYGHRQKGACDDIEVLSEPGTLDAADLLAKVRALSPKGKTPMTQAVRRAAEALKFTERKATVILVSDGIETCDPDPCAVAAELEKLGVGLTVHTVGFGLDDKGAAEQLKCLAETTGGIAVLADNAGELEEALTRTVEAKSEPAPEPEPAPQPEQDAAVNLTGEATMAEGVPFPEGFDSVAWDVYRAVDGARGDLVQSEYGVRMQAKVVEAGNYVVNVRNGQAALDVPVAIVDGKTAAFDVSLEAGILTLDAMLDESTRAPDDGLAWELLSTSGEYIAAEYGQHKSFLAPAGNYKIRLTLGQASIEQEATIAAGKISEVVVTLGAGVAEATAVFAAGGPPVPDGAAIELFRAEAAPDGSHEHVSTEYHAVSRFNVPAGDYLVVVTLDYAKGEGMLTVPAGGLGKAEVNLDAGYLAIDGPDGGVLEVYGAEKGIDGSRTHIATEYNGDIDKAFEVGRYHVVLSRDGEVVAEKQFEVVAGQRTEGQIP